MNYNPGSNSSRLDLDLSRLESQVKCILIWLISLVELFKLARSRAVPTNQHGPANKLHRNGFPLIHYRLV